MPIAKPAIAPPHPDRSQPVGVPGVWRADAWAHMVHPTVSTGHAPLDAVLPGRGWPQGALCELLPTRPAQPEWRLLQPALTVAAASGRLVLIRPPAQPNAVAWEALGVAPSQWLWVDATTPAQRLWSAEQALRCPGVAAVLLWINRVDSTALRRLHLQALSARIASEAPTRHGGRPLQAPLLFVLRPPSAAGNASPAPLRLQVTSLGPVGLQVQVLKRRGPPLDCAIDCPAPLPVGRILSTPGPTPAPRLFRPPSPTPDHAEPLDQLPAYA